MASGKKGALLDLGALKIPDVLRGIETKYLQIGVPP